jgi:hypothetical protein
VPRKRHTTADKVPEPLLILAGHERGKPSQQVPAAPSAGPAAATTTAATAGALLLLLLLWAAAQCCNESVSKGRQVPLAPVTAAAAQAHECAIAVRLEKASTTCKAEVHTCQGS